MPADSWIYDERIQIWFFETRFELVSFGLYNVSLCAQYSYNKMTLLLINNWNPQRKKNFFSLYSVIKTYLHFINQESTNQKS